MVLLCALPILASGLLALLGPRLSRMLPPSIAVVGLATSALVAALSMGFALSVLGLQLVAQFGPIAAWGQWSVAALNTSDPIPGALAALAGILAVALMGTSVRQAWRTGRMIATASAVCRHLGPDAGGLVVVEDEHADAFTVPGLLRGRIVVSTSMLRALDDAERQALLAHETAHLLRRHHVFVHLVDVAAAANPLLRPLRREVRIGVERWADEFAARSVGDRRTVARALARAGLARMSTGSTLAVPGALAIADTELARRVEALLVDVPRRRPLLTLPLAVLVAGLLATMLVTAQHLDAHFDTASAVYHLRAR